MLTAKELRERCKALAAEVRKLADAANGKPMSAEADAAWKKVNADYDEARSALTIADRAEAIEAETNAGDRTIGREDTQRQAPPTTSNASHNANDDTVCAVRAWALNHSAKKSLVRESDVAAAKRVGIDIGDREIVLPVRSDGAFERMQRNYRTMSPSRAFEESRALGTQIGQQGGYTVAPNFSNTIESAMLYYGPMLQTSEVIRTATGADLPFMTDNETTKTGAYIGENATMTTTEGITFGVTVLKAYKSTTNAILVPYEFLRDTSINPVTYIGGKLGERLGRWINTESTTGAIKVRGITSRTTSGVTAAATGAVTFDELIGLVHSVDIAYRQSGAWMFNDTTALALRKLKYGTGEYIWSNGAQAGQPDRLLGFPVFINNDMVNMATTTKSIVFGDLSRYKIRMVEEIRLTQTDQRYWEFDQTAFAAYVCFDGDLLDAGTHPVKHITMA